jgi:ABC-2 type transport system ATP-binding protein
MLTLEHLKKYYATQKAVDDISLQINKGTIYGLLGPNGAGKSSLLRMVTGITLPDAGKILFDGQPFKRHRTQQVHWLYARRARSLQKDENR